MIITIAKIGSARILFVTILSILSDVERAFRAFFTEVSTAFVMKSYLAFVITLSTSSSHAFSRFSLIFSSSALSDSERVIFSRTLASFSRSFTANHLRWLSAHAVFGRILSAASIAASVASSNLTIEVAAFLLDASTALSISLSRPSVLRAEISTISHPSC